MNDYPGSFLNKKKKEFYNDVHLSIDQFYIYTLSDLILLQLIIANVFKMYKTFKTQSAL